MKFPCIKLVAACFLVAASSTAHAGIYSDDMSRCLVSNTSAKDKTDLVRWIFAISALHPDLSSVAAVTEPQRDDMNRKVAKLLERLLTESCRKQTQEALKYEGSAAMQQSFQVLGQVAMQELMSNAAVANGFSGFSKYVDKAKLEELAPKAK
ncbi:MAG: hypothetical protein KJ587_19695 [Alphaproteobacteria bacterium]|nr:hypothetical protein [Alphaproteobacteria bacterium]